MLLALVLTIVALATVIGSWIVERRYPDGDLAQPNGWDPTHPICRRCGTWPCLPKHARLVAWREDEALRQQMASRGYQLSERVDR